MLRDLYNFLFGPNRAAPKPGFASEQGYRRLQKRMASLIGAISLGVPLVALGVALQPGRCFPDSISHLYYWEGYGDLFVAALVSIATLMFIFRAESVLENVSASLAGLGALGVALIPTANSGCETEGYSGRGFGQVSGETFTPRGPFEAWPGVENYHYAAAALLIVVLCYYCFFVFTRCVDDNCRADGTLRPTKIMRNRIYRACGTVIALIIAAFTAQSLIRFDWWEGINATFWLEAIALLAFGVAWSVKGRIFNSVLKDDPTS